MGDVLNNDELRSDPGPSERDDGGTRYDDSRSSGTGPRGTVGSVEDEASVDGGARPRRRAQPDLTRLGRYTIIGRLGQGGMGTVYDAIDHSLDRRVAVKVLRRASERRTQRLIREAQAMAKLSHPNVVQVYEVGEVDGRAFVAMELVEGETVSQWIRRQPRPDWRACVQVFIQLGQGLAAAHAQGLVHRDFKPANAIIDDEGRARVLDFGLARQAGARAEGYESSADSLEADDEAKGSALSTPMTRTGAMLGTPAYMSPEQMLGGEVDAISDQFNFCAALWEVLYGGLPFAGDSVESQAMLLMEERIAEVPPNTGVPRRLHALLVRGLALKRTERWPSMDALLVELRALVEPRSRKWCGAAVGGVGLLAVAGAWTYQSYVAHRSEEERAVERDVRCTGARAQLDGIWDPARRRQVREAFEQTTVSHAAETRALVESTLDDYADRWVEAHTATCRATRVTQEQGEQEMSLRLGCLRERKVALDELVKVLTRADAAMVGKAATLAVTLPTLSRCDDVEALRAEQPPPEDPTIADAVRNLREQLAQVRVLNRTGAYEEAKTAIDGIVDISDSLGYEPLRAESRLVRGRLHKNRGDYAEAEADLALAYSLGVEHRHPAVATAAASTLIFVVGYRQAKYEAGLQWSQVALARARSPGSEPENEALVLSNLATVHKHRGELEPAVEAYQEALAIFEKHRGPRHLSVARSLGNLAGVLYMQGKKDESLRYFERAWPILERSLGANHPELAIWLSNMGSVLSDQGKHQEALEQLQRALAIQEQATKPSVSLAITIYNIGDAFEDQGKPAEALVHYRRALGIFEIELGPTHPELATPLGSIAMILLAQGELDESERFFQRALDIEQEALGDENPRVVVWMVGLAKVALERRDVDAAQAHARRALDILDAAGSDPVALASARFVLARALWNDRARRTEARALAEHAREAWAASDGNEEQAMAARDWLAAHPPQ